MNDGGDVALGPAKLVLQGGVQRAGERPRVDALAVVLHRLDDGAGVDGRTASGRCRRRVLSGLRRGRLGVGGGGLVAAGAAGEDALGELAQGLRQVAGRFRQGGVLDDGVGVEDTAGAGLGRAGRGHRVDLVRFYPRDRAAAAAFEADVLLERLKLGLVAGDRVLCGSVQG